jgi:CheY-like chemotaxis protein
MEILLVEDDLEDAGMTIGALRSGQVPCRVSLVRDGEEAMEFLHRAGKSRRAPRPDLILLDLHLPKKSGREVLAEVRADAHLAPVPVVILTSSTSYLTKPVDLPEFDSVVKSLRKYMLSDVILPS